MTESVRVVQWAAGNTGSVALQVILDTPALDLAAPQWPQPAAGRR